MMSDQPAAMMEDGMTGNGMPDCDGCAGDEGSLAVCTMLCGSPCAGDLGLVQVGSTHRLLARAGVSVASLVLPAGAVRSPDPPRPKPHSF
jgi:hypothetical protein